MSELDPIWIRTCENESLFRSLSNVVLKNKCDLGPHISTAVTMNHYNQHIGPTSDLGMHITHHLIKIDHLS